MYLQSGATVAEGLKCFVTAILIALVCRLPLDAIKDCNSLTFHF
jgi:hypothetical protein